MSFLSSRIRRRACGLAWRVGVELVAMYFLRLELEWISWIIVKIVRMRRKPEARFCFETCFR